MDSLVRQASSMADSVVASVSEGVQAVNEAIAAEIGREEQRIAADAELDDFIVAERLAQEEAEAAAAAAATALRDLQAVNVKLRSVNEVASPVGRRKSSTITLDASLDIGDAAAHWAATGDPEPMSTDALALTIMERPKKDLHAEVTLPDGSLARLTRGDEDEKAGVYLGGCRCASIEQHDEITYARTDGSGATLVLSLAPGNQATKIAAGILNFASFGALCCSGDVTSTVYDARRVDASGGEAAPIGRVIVDNSRGKARNLVIQMAHSEDSAKLDLLLCGFYLAADLATLSSRGLDATNFSIL